MTEYREEMNQETGEMERFASLGAGWARVNGEDDELNEKKIPPGGKALAKRTGQYYTRMIPKAKTKWLMGLCVKAASAGAFNDTVVADIVSKETNLPITYRSIESWKQRYPHFRKAMEQGRHAVVDRIEHAATERALSNTRRDAYQYTNMLLKAHKEAYRQKLDVHTTGTVEHKHIHAILNASDEEVQASLARHIGGMDRIGKPERNITPPGRVQGTAVPAGLLAVDDGASPDGRRDQAGEAPTPE